MLRVEGAAGDLARVFGGRVLEREMGITNRFFPKENAPNGNQELLARFKHTTDPEDQVDPATGKGDIDIVADYMRFLAAPPTLARRASTAVGESAFFQAGCQHCHTPTMQNRRGPRGGIESQKVSRSIPILLLHDMGSLGDGIAQTGATVREIKDATAVGLRASAPYLHDGRATTIDAAIRAHDVEGSVSRDRYMAHAAGIAAEFDRLFWGRCSLQQL